MTPLGTQKSDVSLSLSARSPRCAIRGSARFSPSWSALRAGSQRAAFGILPNVLYAKKDVCRRDASNGRQGAGAPRGLAQKDAKRA